MSYLELEEYAVEQALIRFSYSDLYTSSIELFKALNYPIIEKRNSINLEINLFIHSYINKNVLFSIEEYDLLDKIENISILFSLDTNLQEMHEKMMESTSNKILFMAIDLKSSTRERSYDAHNITKIISKTYKNPIFFLFHNDNNILFSGIIKELLCEKKMTDVYLSDWFNYNAIDLNDIVEMISRLSYGNQHQKDVYSFYYDLLYAISREYYLYPMSKEYLRYGCISYELKQVILDDHKIIEDNSLISILDLTEINSNYYKNLYGDDYIDNSESIELFFAEEDEMLIMEIENDIFLELDYEKGINSNEKFEYDEVDDLEEEEEGLMDEADDELFDDPITLLEWIEKKIE